MEYYELNEEEQIVLDDFESGSLESVSGLEERKHELREYAKNTLNKTRNINIRLSERDLYRLKAKAVEEGLPYQTLASSILHKAAK
jgi:predicted DNA binding CopG/RHH family protein